MKDKDWVIPPLEEEIGEFKRVSRELEIDLPSLISLYEKGTVGNMDEETWSKLENTDSWLTTDLKQVFKIAERSGRNVQALLEAFQAGQPMQTPIVLFLSDGRTHLVSGNTRLMLCRAIGERPKILKLVQ